MREMKVQSTQQHVQIENRTKSIVVGLKEDVELAVNNYRKISEGQLMKGWRKREDLDGKHKDTGGKEGRGGRDGAEPSAGHGRERVAC